MTDQPTDLSTDPELLFRTSRLDIRRRWRPPDLDGYAELNSDPEVMTHLGGRPLSRAESDAFARYGEQWQQREQLGLLPVLRRADGALLGMCGLHRHRWYPQDVEVGWRFARHAWGSGYATEAATCWLDHAFGALGLPLAISITVPANRPSLAVMSRLGMTPYRQDRHQEPAGPIDVVVYAITADRWQERQVQPVE
jgi:RimJ/RimL family protein N-acetyltransferase